VRALDAEREDGAAAHGAIHSLIGQWLGWGLAWMVLFPAIGAIISTKLTHPDFLGALAWLDVDPVRPIHAGQVIWGTFSTLSIGLAHYVMSRLWARRLWKAEWSYVFLWAWNLNLGAVVVVMATGGHLGWEAGGSTLPNTFVMFLILIGLLIQFLATIKASRATSRCSC